MRLLITLCFASNALAFSVDGGSTTPRSIPASVDAGTSSPDPPTEAEGGVSRAHGGGTATIAQEDAPLAQTEQSDGGITLGEVERLAPSTESPRAWRETPVWKKPGRGAKHPFIPALEGIAFDLSIFAFNNLVSRQPFARVTWDDIQAHFDGRNGWVFDVDYFFTNQFGHPYQGAMVHTAARSSGMSFWESSLYTFFASLAWEYLFERDAPSINDQITTTLGGVLLGEVLHRTYRFLVDGSAGPPTWYSKVAATVLSPASAFNRWLFNDDVDHSSIQTAPPFHARFETGLNLATRFVSPGDKGGISLVNQGPQVVIGGELLYGAPSDPDWHYRAPFSHFDASVALTFPGIPSANLSVRGLLLGGQFGKPESSTRGLWGMFGLYDFGANNIVRVSSVGLGMGTTIHSQLTDGLYFRGTAIVGALGFAAAGSLGIDPEKDRDYHIGPGVQGILEGRFILARRWELSLRGRIWAVNGGYLEPGEGY
ncbi:MAG: DUF3943 domain-containing protein, partial [Myxococcaceae bacterium]